MMATTNGNAKAVLGVPFMDEFAIAQAFEELEAASSSECDSSGSSGGSYDESSNASCSEVSDEGESIESSITSCSDDSSDHQEAHPNGIPELLEFTEDELADVTQCLASNAIVSALAERGAMMMSINWLAAHVPICVLDHLGEEIRATGDRDFRHASNGDICISDRFERENDSTVSELSNQQYPPKCDLYAPDECDTIDRPRNALHRHDSGLNLRDENPSLELDDVNHCDKGGSHPVRLRRNSLQSSFLAGMGVQMKIAAIAHAENDDDARQHTEGAEGKARQRSVSPTITRRSSATEMSSDARHLLFDSDTRNSLMPSSNARQLPIPENGVLDENCSPEEGISVERRLLLRAFGLGVSTRNGVRGDAPASTYRDPFPDTDSDNGKQKDMKTSLGSGTRTSRRRSSLHSRRQTKDFGAEGNLPLPHASAHQCALLFVDISGFTRLATALDPEHLSKAINSYFQMIINEVTAHGGDVLKFAGDGIFVEWKASMPGSLPGLMGSQQRSLTECVRVAAVCAASIVAKCSDFPIFAHNPLGSGGQGSQVATLNVHCGLGVGQIVGVHVGDYESRREYVILGDPIDQVCTAVNAATLGEVATSPQALVTLTKSCSFHESVLAGPQNKPAVIASRTMSLFHSRNGVVSENAIVPPPLQLAQTVEAWQMASLKRLQKLMALYVHPVVVANDSSTRLNPRSMSTVQERHREEAELRSVFVLFITPLISVRVTGRKEADNHLFNLLNNIMNLATRELNRFSGHLRQFIVDDKGVVLIATFGLRGSTFPNMVAERALPATITLHNALQSELGVQNQVGATIGNTYCGVVGGIKRHEYAVMGPSVNLAARLMSSPKNPGILVDNAVRMVADKSYAFNALPPVKAKGYSEPVPIFEPLSPLERSWGRVQPNFVGRKSEIMTIKGIAREMALTQCPSTIVYISGESGMGKSTLVVHSIEHVRKLMGATRRRVIITKHVSKESDLLVPFGIFRSILVSVLSYFKTSQDDRSYASLSSSGMDSIGWESLSGRSFDASVSTGLTRSADRFSVICRELNAPAAFEELVGHHLLGVENKPRESFKMRAKASNMKSLVTFMAKAFKRCIQEADLVLVALDDVHNMDEMSWKVVQELFETTSTILFLCTSRPMSTYRLLVDAAFWSELNGEFMAQGRFHLMTVERLQDKEVKTMIAKTLGLQESEISATLLNDVLMQSNGMPHFANEILETMKRQNGNGTRLLDEEAGEVAYTSVGELLLHRIDSFDASVRKVLNIGAVLGSSFEMKVLVAVLLQMSKEKLDFRTVCTKAKCALDVAVSEGILYAVLEGGDILEENNDDTHSLFGDSPGFQDSWHSIGDASTPWTVGSSDSHLVYSFCHDIWRTTILNLMLDSRKRDMHLTIAKTLEKQDGSNNDDYLSRMKLFSHWRASGESEKAASLALSIGRSFEELGLQDQSTKVFQDALSMWNVGGESEGKFVSICSVLFSSASPRPTGRFLKASSGESVGSRP
jgi:class 3 adenylate cyclase